MNSEPLVSVIIPVYGVEKYINQCLDSVVNQTYKNLEIIVVNDGTKDRSAIIAKEYEKKDSRVKVYDFENGGLSVARNRGVNLATGKYIAFLDSDDWIDVNMYKTLVEKMEEYKLDLVECGVTEFNMAENTYKVFKYKNPIIKKILFTKKSFDAFLHTVVWNALYTRELARQVVYPKGLIHEDNYASGLYHGLASKEMSINQAFYFYRINPLGLSRGVVKRPLDKSLCFALLVKDLEKLGLDAEISKWQLACELYHYIRSINGLHKVIALKKELYTFLMNNLDIRRRFLTKYMLKKEESILFNYMR